MTRSKAQKEDAGRAVARGRGRPCAAGPDGRGRGGEVGGRGEAAGLRGQPVHVPPCPHDVPAAGAAADGRLPHRQSGLEPRPNALGNGGPVQAAERGGQLQRPAASSGRVRVLPRNPQQQVHGWAQRQRGGLPHLIGRTVWAGRAAAGGREAAGDGIDGRGGLPRPVRGGRSRKYAARTRSPRAVSWSADVHNPSRLFHSASAELRHPDLVPRRPLISAGGGGRAITGREPCSQGRRGGLRGAGRQAPKLCANRVPRGRSAPVTKACPCSARAGRGGMGRAGGGLASGCGGAGAGGRRAGRPEPEAGAQAGADRGCDAETCGHLGKQAVEVEPRCRRQRAHGGRGAPTAGPAGRGCDPRRGEQPVVREIGVLRDAPLGGLAAWHAHDINRGRLGSEAPIWRPVFQRHDAERGTEGAERGRPRESARQSAAG